MYGVEVIAAPTAQPVTVAELRTWLRLNHQAEDGLLSEYIDSAVWQFEEDTNRPILSTTYRQTLTFWPCDLVIILGRGGVTAVNKVSSYDAAGVAADLATTLYLADFKTPPARVTLASAPAEVTTSGGITRRPVGCVEFAAGWASAAAVPQLVKRAVKLLAAFFYENREAYRDSAFEMRELPKGWRDTVNKFKLGISGTWGQ